MKMGDQKKIVKSVTEKESARAYGSGSIDVLATPAMIAFMEEASLALVDPTLEVGKATVGTGINIKHVAPTPIGDEVTITTVLDEIDGKRLVFSVAAYDSQNKIGEGKHERVIINKSKFMSKLSK